MFAEIVVLSNKTGSNSQTYTYDCSGFEITPGQLVKIPFGSKTYFGIIISVTIKTNLKQTKKIAEVYGKTPIINSQQLTFFTHLAKHYYGALSDIIKLTLPQIAIRQLKNLDQIVNTNKFHQTELILVPSDNQIPAIISGLQTDNYIIYSKNDTPTVRFLKYLQILSGNVQTIISTRSGILLPIKNLSKITIYHEEDVSYQEERAPYYNAIKAAEIRCKLNSSSKLELISSSPSLTSFYERLPNLKIISIKYQSGSQIQSGLLTLIAINEIKTQIANQKSVLLFINRTSPKGFLFCLSCHHKQFLAKPVEDCPNCHSPRIRFSSPNLATLHAEVTKLFPKSKIGILDSKTKPDFRSNIFLATKSALYLSMPEKIGLTVVINTDDLFYPFNFNSEMSGFQTLRRLVSIPSNHYILQSKNPDNLQIDRSLKPQPKQFLIEQLRLRKSFNLPPYTNCMYIFLTGKNHKLLVKKSQKILRSIKDLKGNFSFGETLITKKSQTEIFSLCLTIFHPEVNAFAIITEILPASSTVKINYYDTK